MSEEQEDEIEDLFPLNFNDRAKRFPTKPVLFISSRVHPGELPSSHVLNGILNFILDE
jgi:hypothetical protein